MSTDNGWKPMESAPKGGTIILLKEEDLVHVGWWGGVAGYGWYFLDDTELEPREADGGWTEHFVRPNAWADKPGVGPDGWRELPTVEWLEKQSAALKLAREALIGALSDDQPYINASQEALAAIDALGGTK